MKRGAEKQLSKDDADDEIEEVSAPTGLSVADEATLATRRIKALPKRVSQSPAPSPAPSLNGSPAPTSPSKLGAFSGFGSASGAPFSFAPSGSPSTNKPSSAAPSSTPFSLGPSNSKPLSSSTAPSIASSASNATKTFASFLNPSSVPATPSSSVAPPPNSPPSGLDDVALKYYSSLRGLNTSLLAAISKAVESDPFSNIASLLDQYKNLRISVQKEYDSKTSRPQSSTNGVSATNKPAASSSVNLSSTAPSPAPTSMPAPPASFTGFSSTATSSSSTKPGGGFTPSFGVTDTKSSGFTFPPSSDTKPGPPSATSTLFGGSTSSETSGSDSLKPSFSLPTASTNAFSFTSSDTSKDTSKPSNPFGISSSASTPFGSGFPTARTSTLFGSISGDAKSRDDPDKDKEKPKSAFTFGSSPAPKPFGEGSPFGTSTPEKSSTTSSFFGASSSSPGKSPFSFGSGSGFGFGVSPKSGEASPPGSKTPPVGFSFGTSTATKIDFSAPPPKIDFGAPSSTGDSRGVTPATEGSQDSDAGPQLLSPTAFEKEGQGEEDEETTHEVKAKVYKLTKDKEGKQDWSELGVGVLRLKKHKTNGVRRVFLRNGTTGKIVLNFRIYVGLKPSHQKNTVSFIGHSEAGDSVPYRLRVGKAEAAEDLKNAMDREIEFVRGRTE
ncbi:hypothetical protein OF83DRAFT_1173796 [Amylostereum chailletii]|nr:hypothetical protein OF83DRAFT_1173796 [Amylostereum chailletii]